MLRKEEFTPQTSVVNNLYQQEEGSDGCIPEPPTRYLIRYEIVCFANSNLFFTHFMTGFQSFREQS